MVNLTDPINSYRVSKPPMVWGFPPGASIVDTVPEDMLGQIHPHWEKFPPVNPMWHYLLVKLIQKKIVQY